MTILHIIIPIIISLLFLNISVDMLLQWLAETGFAHEVKAVLPHLPPACTKVPLSHLCAICQVSSACPCLKLV